MYTFLNVNIHFVFNIYIYCIKGKQAADSNDSSISKSIVKMYELAIYPMFYS